MYYWRLEELNLPLKFTWKISRGQSDQKKIFLIHLSDGENRSLGEVAGITKDDNKSSALIETFNEFVNSNPQNLDSILNTSMPSHLKFGITSAWTHLQAIKNKKSVGEFLELPVADNLPTSYALPIMDVASIGSFIEHHNLSRFPSLKIKVNAELAWEICSEVRRNYKGPLRIDANEAFSNAEQARNFMVKLSDFPIEFIEQPLKAGTIEESIKLKSISPYPLVADEDIQSDLLQDWIPEAFHGINVKLMKAGSYQRALEQLSQAKSLGLTTMLGCMVETSLGIAGAMTLADSVDYFDLDGFLYFLNEPFSHVIENKGILSYQQNTPFKL